MTISQRLQQTILSGEILTVQVGMSRTVVMAKTTTGIRCGLAATLANQDYEHHSQPAVRDAGHLHKKDYRELAALIDSLSLTEASIGLATINALLPVDSLDFQDLNGHDYLAVNGKGKNVALIGHFPFIEQVRSTAKNLWVFELYPREGDLPAESAPEYLPRADIIAMTATTLINKTFDHLITLCRPEARIIMLGPSTPLTPVLFDYGVHVLSGTIVLDPQETLLGIGQGGSVHLLHEQGFVRFVTAVKDRLVD